ncbi:hypothetical protein GGI12_005943, partial [Dipsacomyces acuminosporus]
GNSTGNGITANKAKNHVAIWLPSDVIDAIADAAVATTQQYAAHDTETMQLYPFSLSASAQAVLRTLSQVCRQWRASLLHRAWRTVELTGATSPSTRTLHAYAGLCAKRLVVPWGAMAAPVSWQPETCADEQHQGTSYLGGCSSSSDAIGYSADSYSRICTHASGRTIHPGIRASTSTSTGTSTSISKAAASAATATSMAGGPGDAGASRLQCIFGDRVWPGVEHLDMAFMPLICYQGLVAHIHQAMPRLRTLRIGGFVPATTLAEILGSCLPLTMLEVSGSVWANAGDIRRGSGSSWRSSASTITVLGATADDTEDADAIGARFGSIPAIQSRFAHPSTLVHHQSCAKPAALQLAVLAVTADALRSPIVFSFAMAQLDTLEELRLLDSDYKIMDMLRSGFIDERHMHAVEYGSTQM